MAPWTLTQPLAPRTQRGGCIWTALSVPSSVFRRLVRVGDLDDVQRLVQAFGVLPPLRGIQARIGQMATSATVATLIVLTLARRIVIVPVGREPAERNRRLVRYCVKEVGQARAAMQAHLVVPVSEGVNEQHPFLVGGCLSERRQPDFVQRDAVLHDHPLLELPSLAAAHHSCLHAGPTHVPVDIPIVVARGFMPAG
jgi:hypothetical protein